MINTKERLQIPELLLPNAMIGRPFLNKLKKKWRPSSALSNLIARLTQVHELSIRSPADHVEILEAYCEKLLLLNIACKDLVNYKAGAELETVEATDEFVKMWLDLEALMALLINRSEAFLNINGTAIRDQVALPAAVTSRMRATFDVPIDYPEDFKKKPANLWHKTAARAGMAAGLVGGINTVAKGAAGVDQNAVLVTAAVGGTVATGPLALAAIGATKATVGHALAARSAVRTKHHIRGLEDIKKNEPMYPSAGASWVNRGAVPCKPLPGGPECNEEHGFLLEDVLDYLILQKRKKKGRKTMAAIPFVGMAEDVRGIARGTYKTVMGTKGVMRKEMAAHLAKHIMQCDCCLAQDIVSELLSSREKMEWLKWQEYDVVLSILVMKFKGS